MSELDHVVERIVRKTIADEFKMVDDKYTEIPAPLRGKPWQDKDDELLVLSYHQMLSVLANCFGRSVRAIRLNLNHLGEFDDLKDCW